MKKYGKSRRKKLVNWKRGNGKMEEGKFSKDGNKQAKRK